MKMALIKEGKIMNLKMKKIILTWFLSVFLVFSVTAGAYAYSEILALGDSLSDNGYYQGFLGGTAGNTNPADIYGFRRYSNGPVWVEYLAQDLGVPLFDMAYGGATTNWDNPAAFSATANPDYLTMTGLQWQVATYQSFYGTIDSNALVTVWAGGNDMFNDRNPVTAAENIALAIQNLIALGGDSFLIPNLNITNAWIMAFDPALDVEIDTLRLANPGVNLYELDMNAFVPTGIDFYTGTYLAQTYGSGVYAWWDTVGVHPTTQVHEQIAAYAATRVPEPASIILLIIGFVGLAGVRKRMR